MRKFHSFFQYFKYLHAYTLQPFVTLVKELMEVQRRKRRTIFFKIIRRTIRSPLTRIRNLIRNLLSKHRDQVAMILVIMLGIIILFVYFKYRFLLPFEALYIVQSESKNKPPRTTTTERQVVGSPMIHVRLDEVYKEKVYKSKEDYSFELEERHQAPPKMVNTLGCQIPVAMVSYKNNDNINVTKSPCEERAVFLDKLDKDKVRVYLKTHILRKRLKRSPEFYCCYRFIRTTSYNRDTKTNYTDCNRLENGHVISLKSDFINVKCFEYDKKNNVSENIYEDLYAFIKTKNVSNSNQKECKIKFNVLLLGISSMSLPRFVQLMPRTVEFFRENFWLGFRGYSKVGEDSFHNLMATFTGRTSSLSEKCLQRLDKCTDLIWNKYKKMGYVTAYGEDYLQLPDAFSNCLNIGKTTIDHYLNSIFRKGETKTNSSVCTGKVTSIQQLLDFAFDFANTYRRNSFFGTFWTNSISHDVNSRPQDADVMFENFFNRLTYTGVLDNTFIIFFSDHGIRFGNHRLKVESFYDERMPILFIGIPRRFSARHYSRLKSLATNQFRLTTPYDLFNTLLEIKFLSSCNNLTEGVQESPDCPKCHSMFKTISVTRTCEDVTIEDKWCSCHNLYPLDIADSEGMKKVLFAVAHIKSIVQSIKTKKCWSCRRLHLKKVIRIHFYYNREKTGLYYVVAFIMTPGDLHFEATVLKQNKTINVVGTISVISAYDGLDECALNWKHRVYCVCEKIDSCK